MPVRPVRPDTRLGSHSASGAADPPIRWLRSASWRSAASPALKVSRTYSERMEARLPARASATRTTSTRRRYRSAARSAPRPIKTPMVRAAITDFAGQRHRAARLGGGGWNSANGRWMRCRKAVSKSTPSPRSRSRLAIAAAAGFVEQPARGERARRVGELRLAAGETAEADCERAQRHRRLRRDALFGPARGVPVSSAVASPSFSHVGTPRAASVRMSACVNSCDSTRSSSAAFSSAPRIGTRSSRRRRRPPTPAIG